MQATTQQPTIPSAAALPLQGIHALSLALNLPGPATLLRCKTMGAECTKIEPMAPSGSTSADPMVLYSPSAYAQLHAGVHILQANLKTAQGQALLQEQLAQTDVLITSFRPSALNKLGLNWDALHAQHPRLGMVRIFGDSTPELAEHPGHDLTYQAQAGLTDTGAMPASLFADMAGALQGSEAVLQTLLLRAQTGYGHCLAVGLAQAAQWLAMPLQWNMTTPTGDVGGAHAGYRMYACIDGWVAVAALEPHFAQRLCNAAGIQGCDGSTDFMRQRSVHAAIGEFLQHRCGVEIEAMATKSDIPLRVVSAQNK